MVRYGVHDQIELNYRNAETFCILLLHLASTSCFFIQLRYSVSTSCFFIQLLHSTSAFSFDIAASLHDVLLSVFNFENVFSSVSSSAYSKVLHRVLLEAVGRDFLNKSARILHIYNVSTPNSVVNLKIWRIHVTDAFGSF